MKLALASDLHLEFGGIELKNTKGSEVHGHTHHKFSYNIGSSMIKCNPRGYIGYEAGADQFEPEYIDV